MNLPAISQPIRDRWHLWLSMGLALLVLTACGLKGPLYLYVPPLKETPKTESPAKESPAAKTQSSGSIQQTQSKRLSTAQP